MILYYKNVKNFFIISDTLINDMKNYTPVQYATKVFTVPHLDCFIFGIGVFNFTKAFYDNFLNIITDNFDYMLESSEKMCIDIYHNLKLHENNIFTKVFLAKRNGKQIDFVSFTNEENFKPRIIDDAIGFFPDNKIVSDKLYPELNKNNIEISGIVNILKINEDVLDSGGEYYLHMFSDENNILISRLGKSVNYKNKLKKMIENCSIISERKGVSIYFDQNIWGNLLNEIELQNFSSVEKIIKKIQDSKMNIGYSSINIKETLRRGKQEKILQELTLIKKLTYNIFIDQGFKFIYKNPFDLWKQKKDIDPIVDKFIAGFKSSFDELINSKSTVEVKKYFSSSRIMNNIRPEEIFAHLDTVIMEQMRNLSIYDKNLNIMRDAEVFYNKVVESIMIFLRQSFNEFQDAEFENLFKKLEIEMKNKGKEILNQEIKVDDFKATELDLLFKKLGHKEEFLPGFMTGFLEASNYHPDKVKLKTKKGEIIDSDDMAHVNYAAFFDYFVTEDKRLSERVKAVKDKMGMKTKILKMNEFIDLIDSL